jgi:hypothetical protein
VADFATDLALRTGATVAVRTTRGDAATRTASTTTITTATVTTTTAAVEAATTRVVHGSTELQLHVRLVLETMSLEGNEVREHVVEGEGLTIGHHGGDEGIILDRKSWKQISEHLFITKWSVGGSELVGEPCDLAEEVSSRMIMLFGSREFN